LPKDLPTTRTATTFDFDEIRSSNNNTIRCSSRVHWL